MHSIAAFESHFSGQAYDVDRFSILCRQFTSLSVAETKKACNVGLHVERIYAACDPYRLVNVFQKNPRYGDPLGLSRNSHVRPWANCVDQ